MGGVKDHECEGIHAFPSLGPYLASSCSSHSEERTETTHEHVSSLEREEKHVGKRERRTSWEERRTQGTQIGGRGRAASGTVFLLGGGQ